MAKLLVEDFDEVEVLHENTESGKKLYIEGKFAVAEQKNGNGRIYPKSILESAVQTYQDTLVSKKRALGELNHPKRPYPDPQEAAILIESLEWRGNDVYGKAIVLPTPKGDIVRGLIEGGWSAGVSTRGVGTLKEQGGINFVQDDFRMFAVDVVDGPSGPGCNVAGIYESLGDYVLNESTGLYEKSEHEFAQMEHINEIALLNAIDRFIEEMKK
ncbi:MAG: prohead core scaffolding protein and protease [Candidatus Peribacteraceae bacterium]|nr:prohead core scaffolding protein and protease [Candidatus Peribacteraceae bacterium]